MSSWASDADDAVTGVMDAVDGGGGVVGGGGDDVCVAAVGFVVMGALWWSCELLGLISSSVATIRLSPLCISSGVPIKCLSLMCNCKGSCLCVVAVGFDDVAALDAIDVDIFTAAVVVENVISVVRIGYWFVVGTITSSTAGNLPILRPSSFSPSATLNSCLCGLPEVHSIKENENITIE